jgi:hypothetical protein
MSNQQGASTYDSALQLYDEAYRQHYEQGNIPQACVLYREIIRNFPDSFESVYAVIQLEKIGMREAIKHLNSGGWVKTVAIIALILSMIAVGLASVTFMSTFFA